MIRSLTTTLFFAFALTTFSQDYHHWSEHFGTRASLLGGAATSGLGDNATVYYNSAAMSFVDNPNLSITVNAYKLRTAKMENALGKDLDLKETQIATFPSLIAGIFEFKNNERLKIGYSVNTKTSFQSKFDYLHQGEYEVLDSIAGPENYVASYGLHHSITEYWAGVALSYRLTDAMSVGLAHYGIYRDVKYSNYINTAALPLDPGLGDFASVSSSIDFKYWNVKGVFKPSIAFQWPKSKLGITYTSPSFNILGKANVYREFSIVNLDEEIGTDVTFVDRREKQKATHRSPGALAIGVSKKFGTKTWVHFTNEFFNPMPYYLLFNPENPVNSYPQNLPDSIPWQIFGEQNYLAYGEEYHPLINFGLGIERQVNPRTNIMVGARTDFNYNARPYYIFQRIGIESSKWPLYHFSAGLAKHTKKNKIFTAGLEFAVSPRQRFHQYVNFTNPSSEDLLVGTRQFVATTKQFGFKVVLGVEIGNSEKPSLE